jgi:hypothetical protein
MCGNEFHHLRVDPRLRIDAAAQYVEVQIALTNMSEQHRDRVRRTAVDQTVGIARERTDR